jgi:hypothetical protein
VLLSTALVAAAAPAFTFRAGDNLSYDAPEGRIEPHLHARGHPEAHYRRFLLILEHRRDLATLTT